MTFSVNTYALAGLPPFFDRRDRDLSRGASYITTHTTLDDGAGLANVLGVHERVITDITSFLRETAGTYAAADAARTRAVLKAYHDSDMRAAARADAAVPFVPADLPKTPPITPAEQGFGPTVFDDRTRPEAALLPPGDHYSDMPYQPSWFDALSPTGIARDAIWRLSQLAADVGFIDRAYDPFEMLVEPFVGDWAGLLRCAEVFTNVHAMMAATATCVRDAKGTVPLVWTGNVAGMAEINLESFATLVSDGIVPLDAIATAYREVAHGVQDNANLLEMIITSLIDETFDGALDAATFGVFDIYDVGVRIRNFAKTLLAAVRIAANVVDLVSAGFAASNDAVNRLGLLRNVPSMPGVPLPVPPIPWPAPINETPRVPVPHG